MSAEIPCSQPGGERGNSPTSVLVFAIVVVLCGQFFAHFGREAAVSRWSRVRVADDPKVDGLCSAVDAGNAARVRLLLERGADVNGRDCADQTPLMRAALGQQLEVCRLLLARGADADAVSGFGWTAMMLVAAFGEEPIVQLLLGAGAHPDAPTPSGRTALMAACSAGNDDMAAALLAAGADVNGVARDGVTPLIDAAASETPQSLQLVRRLLDAGAQVGAADNNGTTALMMAAGADSPEVIRLLLARGADPRALDREGRDAIAFATVRGSASCVFAVAMADCEQDCWRDLPHSSPCEGNPRDDSGSTDAVVHGRQQQ